MFEKYSKEVLIRYIKQYCYCYRNVTNEILQRQLEVIKSELRLEYLLKENDTLLGVIKKNSGMDCAVKMKNWCNAQKQFDKNHREMGRLLDKYNEKTEV